MRNADAPGPEVTGAGAVNLTVTVLARDAGSGVARVEWYLDSGDVSFHRISGTARDGLWRAVVPLARCANPAGHLSVEPWVMDAVRLQGAATVKTKITILNTDVTAPQADVVNEHVPASGPVHIRFHEDVRGIDSQNAIIQPPAVAPTDQPVPGTWACTTADGVPVDCVNGPVREARFTPAAPFPVYHEEGTVYGPQWHVYLNPEHFRRRHRPGRESVPNQRTWELLPPLTTWCTRRRGPDVGR